MTPTDQTRLTEIRNRMTPLEQGCAMHGNDYLLWCGDCHSYVLIRLLSQETKRANKAEARAWESVAARADKKIAECDSIHAKCVWADARDFATKEAAAVRRGREGKS